MLQTGRQTVFVGAEEEMLEERESRTGLKSYKDLLPVGLYSLFQIMFGVFSHVSDVAVWTSD